jgi:Flp pilus assembly protein TadG
MNVMACVTGSFSFCRGSRARKRIRLVRTYFLRSDETGGSLVEMALVLPILLAIVTGITSFGFAFNNYIMLSSAVNVGGRQLSILRGDTADPCSDVSKTIAAASPLLKSANLNYTFNLNGTTYTNKSTCTGGVAILTSGQGKPMQVQVTYPCTLLIYGKNVLPSCTLTAQVTELEQ